MSSQSSWIADGQQVSATDLNSLGDAACELAGEAIAAIVGVADANADDNPLTVTPGSGMSVIVGGTGQKVLCQQKLCDYLPGQTVAIAPASAAPRYDLLAFAPTDVTVPTGATANFMDVNGNIAPQPTAYVYRGINLTVVTGTPGGALPAAPSGFDPLAQVLVPVGATAITAADITLLLPTIKGLLTALVGGGTCIASVASADNSIAVTTTGQHVDLSVNASAPSAVAKGNVFATGLTSGNTSGSISLGVLPGAASQQYLVRALAVTTFHDESQSLVLTGSGATWPNSPAGAGNGQGGNTPCAMSGTAHGGQNPSVSWSQPALGGTPIYMGSRENSDFKARLGLFPHETASPYAFRARRSSPGSEPSLRVRKGSITLTQSCQSKPKSTLF